MNCEHRNLRMRRGSGVHSLHGMTCSSDALLQSRCSHPPQKKFEPALTALSVVGCAADDSHPRCGLESQDAKRRFHAKT